MEIYFTVSLNGRFVFRTDVFVNNEAGAANAQHALRTAFGSLGNYEIERSERPSTWTSSTVKGTASKRAPKATRNVITKPGEVFTPSTVPTLTELETVVYDALVDNSGGNGGDFACAEEVDTKALKLSKQQFGALLTSLENKRVISVDITYVNNREKVTQVSFNHKNGDTPLYAAQLGGARIADAGCEKATVSSLCDCEACQPSR